jgi:hypothetical protein
VEPIQKGNITLKNDSHYVRYFELRNSIQSGANLPFISLMIFGKYRLDRPDVAVYTKNVE